MYHGHLGTEPGNHRQVSTSKYNFTLIFKPCNTLYVSSAVRELNCSLVKVYMEGG